MRIGVCALLLAGCIADLPGFAGAAASGPNPIGDGIAFGAIGLMNGVAENSRNPGHGDTPLRPPAPLPEDDADFVCTVDGEDELVQAYDLESAMRATCDGLDRCECTSRLHADEDPS